RLDLPNPEETFGALVAAGCRTVSFGVEAGSERILRRVGKGLDLSNAARTLRSAKEAGLCVRTEWIVGLPGSLDEHRKSIDLMLATEPDQINISLCTPYPGTRMGDAPSKYGIKLLAADWTQLLANIYSPSFDSVIAFEHISADEIRC